MTGTVTSWVCAMCGGPRMPEGLGGEAAIAPLREAKTLRGRAARARGASWLFVMMAAFTTLVLVAAWPAALVTKLVLLGMAGLPALLAARSRVAAATANTGAEAALERAWLAAAEQVAAETKQGVTAEELAKRLKTSPERADALLTKLAVHDRTRIDVGDDAEVRYSVSPEVMANARIEDAATTEALLDEADDFAHADPARAMRRPR